MNSKRFFSSISAPFIVENFKMFWIGSAFAMVAYLCACCAPLLIGGVYDGNISSILSVSYGPIVVMAVIIPLVASLLIYSYMQQQSSAAIIHALPYTRKQIFHSGYISGVILCLAPVVVTGSLLMVASIVSEPVLIMEFDPQVGFITYDIFTPENVLLWTGLVCLFNAVIFTVCTFAAVITGSVLAQALMSVMLLGIVPALTKLVSLVGDRMLYGYVEPEWIEKICSYTSAPIAMVMENNAGAIIFQVAMAIALYVASYCLYSRRHIEKARDTLVFNKSKPVFKYIVAFVGMCCLGFFLEAFYEGQGNEILYIGAFVGALVAYVAIDMLIQKRIRIKGFVKGFGLYLIAAVVFFGVFTFDILGYETSTPDAGEVKGVYVEGISAEYYKHYEEDKEFEGIITDQEAIGKVIGLHSAIINEKEAFFDKENASYYSSYDTYGEPLDMSYTWVDITYVMENGKTIKRSYNSIPENWLYSNEDLVSLIESEPYKEMIYPILTWDTGGPEVMAINLLPSYEGEISGKKTVYLNDQEQTEQFFAAIREDLRSLTFEEMNIYGSEKRALFTVEFVVKNTDIISEELNKEYYEYYGYYYSDDQEYFEYCVNINYDNTLALLKEWGLYDNMVVSADDVDRISVVKVESDEVEGQIDYPGVDVTDKETIQSILDTAASDWYNYELRYELIVYPNIRGLSEECFYLYYDPDNVPDFIANLF